MIHIFKALKSNNIKHKNGDILHFMELLVTRA
jgi:hypothetical protein